MTFEIKVLTQGRNYSGCYTFKGYRKDLEKCITAANNAIDAELLEHKHKKDITEFWVTIYSFGKKIKHWKYKPTMR